MSPLLSFRSSQKRVKREYFSFFARVWRGVIQLLCLYTSPASEVARRCLRKKIYPEFQQFHYHTMFAKKVKLDSQVILPLAMFALESGPIIAHPFAQIGLFTLFCFMYLNDEKTDVVIV